MRKPILFLATAVMVGLAFLGWWRTTENREISRTEFLMGTYIEAKAYGRHATAALDQVYSRLRQIEQRMTINQAGSEIDTVNDHAGQQPVAVSSDTFAVVKSALEFARITSGKFDPTVQPIVALWRIGSPEARVPAPSEIISHLPLVNYQRVQLDESAHSIFLPVSGMGLDLGGIAKGYAADEAIAILRQNRVQNALISLGGNIYAMGDNPAGKPWRIGVQDPERERNSYVAVIEATNETLVTSGAYERFLEVDGEIYHHIIDPSTGYPAETDVLSVTIVTTRSIDADALSTSVFILGREAGLELIEQLSGIEAIVIDKNHGIFVSAGMQNRITVTDPLYHLEP